MPEGLLLTEKNVKDFNWRSWIRVVACVNWVLAILSMATVLVIISAGVVTTVLVATRTNENVKVDVWLMWLITAILVRLTAVQFWASLKLISEVEFGMEVYEKAFTEGHVWGNVVFAFSFLAIRVFVLLCITALSLSLMSLAQPGMQSIGFL